jgi:peroxiredoxin
MKTLETGHTAPEFTLELASGGSLSLSEILARGPALFAFYKVSCPTCQLSLPFLERLRGGPFQVYAISQNGADEVREFNEAFEVELPTLLDRASNGYPVSNAFAIAYVPSLFLVEPDRTISWSWVGFHKAKFEELAARAGRAIFRDGERVPESKSG